jgi:hypothetical protein
MPTPTPDDRSSLAPWEIFFAKLMISSGVGVVGGIAAVQAGLNQQDARAIGFLLGGLCALFLFVFFAAAPARTGAAASAPQRPAPRPETPPPHRVPHDLSDSHAFTALHRQLVVDYIGPSAVRNHPGLAGAASEASPPQPPPHAASARPAAPSAPSSRPRPAAAPAHPQPSSSGPRRPYDQSGSFDPADWDEQSFLRRMGYHVGASGPLAWQRQDILRRAYERLLPADMPAAVRAAYGAPQSAARLQRIVSHLHGRISLAERRIANMSQALNHWRADTDWLRETYGSRHKSVNFTGLAAGRWYRGRRR